MCVLLGFAAPSVDKYSMEVYVTHVKNHKNTPILILT